MNIENFPLYSNPTARKAIFSIGLGYLAYKSSMFLKDLIKPLFYTEQDLAKKYGVGTWAVVTGASDGIGKEYCFQLAKRGFNIVLIARSEKKLDDVRNELTKVYPGIQAKIIVADFSKSGEDQFFENIDKELQDLEISILIINAGKLVLGTHHKLSYQDIKETVMVNCMPLVMMTQSIAKKMTLRSKKSAVISISSFAGFYVRPYEALYSATKVFTDFFTRGIAEEYDNIDILSVRPGFVSTKMLDFRPVDLKTCSTADFVNNSFRYLGRESNTHGHWKHRLNAWQFAILPDWLRMKRLAERAKTLADALEK
jgi:17beta-estradiol 17-dehydrogenase / very-long-chain 3-oxoacyl-CoA reductase